MRKPIVAAVCVAAALGLAGCSATTGGSATANPGVSAATSAAVAPAAYTTATELSSALGAATKDKSSAKMAFTLGVGQQTITGTGALADFAGGDPKLQMSMKVAQMGDIDMVLVDRNVYIKIPGAPAGKPWVKSSIDSDSGIGKQFAGFDDQLDVSKQFDQVKDAGTITGSSPDTVDGTPTTRYTIQLDTSKIATNGTPEQQETMKALTDQGVKTIDTQMWVDADNLPRRITTTVPVQGQDSTVDMRYSDWGQPVDISAPPADQVTESPS